MLTENEIGNLNSGKLEKYILSGTSLMQKVIPPTQWVVPDLIPEGLTLLVGKAKMGKSFLALNIALPVSYGGIVLGTTQVEQGRVLYLTPDDPMESRFRARIQGILGEQPMPGTFQYALQWELLDSEGLDLLNEYLQSYQGEVKLVVIDVLNTIMPMYREDATAYQVIYNLLTPLKILAQENHISIVAIMHKNKGKEQGI